MKAKRFLSLLMSLITLVSLVCINTTSASALTRNTKYPQKNITGYILSTNNKTAVAYSKDSCTSSSRIGYIYSTDDCTIQEIYTNGVVKVKCPWTGYSNGRIVYTYLSYFFQNTSSVSTKTATVKTKCYSRSNLSTSLGYVYVGDKCYIVGTSGSYYQVLCPWTGGVYRLCWVNKSAFGTHTHSYVTGYEAAHPHKVYKKCSSCGYYYYTGETKKVSSCTTCYPKTYTGYVNTSSAPLVLRQSASTGSKALANMPKGSTVTVLDNKAKTNGFYHVTYNGTTGYASASYITFTKPTSTSTSSSTSSSGFRYPVNNYKIAQGFGEYNSSMGSGSRKYHSGIDFYSTGDDNIYPIYKGTVVYSDKYGGNGNYVVIKHTINGQTVYSFYAHLYSRSVSKGATVTTSTVIGKMGSTGNSSGKHLHLGVLTGTYNYCFGYVPKFSGKKYYFSTSNGGDGATYYDPLYVIQNGKLPS